MVQHIVTGESTGDGEVYLVTGSHGHIGSYVVEELVKTKDNIQIICVDNFYNADIDNLKVSYKIAENKNIKIRDVRVDITDSILMRETFLKYNPDYVFHCASYLTLDSNNHKSRSVQVNVYGSALLFELCLDFGVKKIVYSSSASVYGTPTIIPTHESYPFDDCKLLYGTSKIATEYIAKSFMEEGLEIVGLRYFNVYGPRQGLSNVYTQIVPKWIRSIVKGEKIIIYGDGKQTMDMIFGADIGRANVAALDNEDCKNMFINVGTGLQTSVINLFDMISYRMKKLLGDPKINLQYEEHDPNLVKRRCADVVKMHKYLGVHQVSVDEGIDITCRELYDRVDKWENHNG
jgi:UDP-glucose 4-epimerase